MNRNPKSIVGKTISGVITRPVDGGLEGVLIVQFSDGSCFEFVSPRSRRLLSRMAGKATPRRAESKPKQLAQLSFFPQDGAMGNAAKATAAAA